MVRIDGNGGRAGGTLEEGQIRGRCREGETGLRGRRGPVVDQVGGIDGSDAGGEVPTCARAIGRQVGVVRGGKNARRGAVQKAVEAARAVHSHVALRHVVEDANRRNAAPVGRTAGGVATGAVLDRSQRVISKVGITLPRTGLLIHERLDACHDGRCEGCSTRTRPTTRGPRTSGATIGSVGPTKDVVVAPKTVRSEERNVRSVPDPVVGIAEDHLPGRFGPALTGAAYHAVGRGSARGTSARTTTPATVV